MRRIIPGKPECRAPGQAPLSRFAEPLLPLSFCNKPASVVKLVNLILPSPILSLNAICEHCSLEEQNTLYIQAVLC